MTDCNGTNSYRTEYDKADLSPAVKNCIQRIIEEEGFTDYTVDVQNISTNGGNYFANLQTIDVKGKSKNGEKDVNLFVKNKIDTSDFNIIPIDEVYKREAFYYNKLVPIYDKLQDEAKVPVQERLKVAKSYEESNEEVTILENLIKKGYQTPHRLEPISLPFAQESIKQLAKFHALSFVLQDRKPEYFENNLKTLNLPVKLDSDWDKYLDGCCDDIAKCLNSELKCRVENNKTNIKEYYQRIVRCSDTMSTCVCHGDFRANNIMITEKNGKITDLVPVDFQMIYMGCPAIDFIYFVFTGSDQKFRRNHLDHLRELYYETFSKFLLYFDIESENVYPKNKFEQDYNDNLGYGLTLFIVLVPFLFCGDDDIPDIQKGMTGIYVNIKDEAAKERIHGVVEDFINWGYL